MRPRGLDHDLEPRVEESLRQRRQVPLQHRLAAGQQHQRCRQPSDFRDDVVHGHVGAAVERERAVTVPTTQVATGGAHKRTGQTCVLRLTLDTAVNLRDSHAAVATAGEYRTYT